MNNDYGDHPDRRTTYPDSPYSEDESTPLQTGSNQALGRHIATEAKGWNVFRDLPPKNDSVSTMNENFAELTIKFLKVLVYLLVFVIVLGSSVISLGTVLLMTSQLRQDRTTVYCNRELGKLKTFVTTLPDEERLTWIWCIIIAFVIPEIGTLIRSVRMCLFKTRVKPRVLHFVFVATMETFHVVGLAIMFLSVLPELDVIQGVILTGAVYFVPGLLGLLSRNKERDESRRYYLAVLDIAAVATQATAFVLTPLHEVSNPSLWLVPVALFLISCGWWENYVSVQSSMILIRTLAQIKREMKSARYFTYAFVSVWKIIVFFLSTMIILHSQSQDFNLFTMIGSIFSNHNITVSEVEATVGGGTIPDLSDVVPDGTSVIMSTEFTTPIFVLLIQVLSSYFAYIVGKFACKIMIQEFSYALSVNLTIPVSISLLIAACALRDNDPCYFHGTIPDYLSYESPVLSALGDFIVNEYAWVWFLWLLSQTWITLHIWTPKCERLAATEKLFVTPMYNGLLINQSLGLNRNRDDQPEAGGDDFMKPGKEKSDTEDDTVFPPPPTDIRKSDFVTKIYVCATMWHENKEEMLEFLKSILRMDQDQCARKNAQNYLNIVDPDYYEFETHIFFDDAFEMADHDENESQVNQFVRLLVDVLDEAASKIHQTQIHVRAPKKYPTPYGGRLVWTLPGNTKMITHLKDKSKIRHRKRWSQVMYMYYLLGHRIMDLPISIPRKEVIAENTYLLALDGDIDFQPSAVKLLVDLMKKNKGLGAACGRIHPVGTGPMVWYQMFEYAVGHWLQKATEHVIGCVLCSPGCFSLFRAKALMDDNVMKKYTTPPTEARHYVQYDQGEDRWLCTLLLQRGYRVEYSAASDAYTHAPEGFYEFYNQRRRWVPSTMANIMDLIGDYKRTVKNNDNISMMYMGYQVLLMGGTILGPGTIFLMLIGACNAAFRLALLTCFYWNFAPIVIFIIVCFTCKSEIQLFVAAVISVAYGLVMMAVIVGILLQTAEDGWLAPSTLFFFLIVGQLVIAGIIHPQELICLPCGIMYYVTIPSMYMLLVIYSITNLNNVTWGTREVQVKKTLAELEEDKKKLEEAKQKASPNSFLSFLRNGGDSKNDDQGSLEFSFAGLCKCVFCMHGKPSDEKLQLVAVTECLEKVLDRLNTMDKPKDSPGQMTGWNRIPSRFTQTPMNPIDEHPVLDEQPPSDSESTVSQNTDTNRKRTFLISPYWLDDESLKKGEVGFLTAKEEQFWDDLIEEYLFPIDEDKAEKARIASDLKDLRNNSSFAFFMVNALFVLILFLMQLNQDQIHIEWPFGASVAISFDLDNLEVHITREYLQLEPIGLAFVSSFGLILAIQFLAMLIHRFGTFAHILASTKLRGAYWCKKPEDLSDESLHSKDAIEIVKDLQRLDVVEDSYSEIGDDNKPARRKTVRILEKGRRTTQNVSNNLDDAFRQRFFSTDENSGLPRKMSARRSTKAFKAFEARRSTVIAERKKSKNDTGGNAVYEASRNPTTLQLGSARTGRPSVDRNYNHRHSAGVVNLAYEPEGSI